MNPAVVEYDFDITTNNPIELSVAHEAPDIFLQINNVTGVSVIDAPLATLSNVSDAQEINLEIIVQPTTVNMTVTGIEGAKGDKGDKGDQGDPGTAGTGSAVAFKSYVAPQESPDGSRTMFTLPDAYMPGSLMVSLNGLVERFVSEQTNQRFSFDTAPHNSDIILASYAVL